MPTYTQREDIAMESQLIEKLNTLANGFNGAELDNYKLLLGIAAGGLAPHGDFPETGSRAQAFETVLRCLAKIQPTGALWRGRPDFMTDELLSQLQAEAEERRKSATRHDRYNLGCGGELADQYAVSAPLVDLVNTYAPNMMPTGIASYLFYDQEGLGLSPHIDTEIFTLNAILMLKHEYTLSPPSHLLLFPVDQPPQRVLLSPGEIILLYAGGTVHAREDMKTGETVHLLTVGFKPVGQ
jgi:hypothetical protein